MAASAAQLLDELMGRNRNALPTDKVKEPSYEDPDVCRYYLVQFCPHDLFVNTKADLGACPKVHDDHVKAKYDTAPAHTKREFEDEFIRYCRGMLEEVNKKIIKGRQRLAAQQGDKENPQVQKALEEIQAVTDKINALVAQAEEKGNAGDVDEAQSLMEQCEALKLEKITLQNQLNTNFRIPLGEFGGLPEKQMEVCEVCGAFLIVGDAPSRLDDHLMGKQHLGYAKMRASVKELMDQREKARSVREQERSKEDEKRKRRDDDGGERRHSRSSRDDDRHSGQRDHRDRDRYRDRGGDDRRSSRGHYNSRGGRDRDQRHERRDRYDRERDRNRHDRNGRRRSHSSHGEERDAKRSRDGTNAE